MHSKGFVSCEFWTCRLTTWRNCSRDSSIHWFPWENCGWMAISWPPSRPVRSLKSEPNWFDWRTILGTAPAIWINSTPQQSIKSDMQLTAFHLIGPSILTTRKWHRCVPRPIRTPISPFSRFCDEFWNARSTEWRPNGCLHTTEAQLMIWWLKNTDLKFMNLMTSHLRITLRKNKFMKMRIRITSTMVLKLLRNRRVLQSPEKPLLSSLHQQQRNRSTSTTWFCLHLKPVKSTSRDRSIRRRCQRNRWNFCKKRRNWRASNWWRPNSTKPRR